MGDPAMTSMTTNKNNPFTDLSRMCVLYCKSIRALGLCKGMYFNSYRVEIPGITETILIHSSDTTNTFYNAVNIFRLLYF